jgi:hypothetical protein
MAKVKLGKCYLLYNKEDSKLFCRSPLHCLGFTHFGPIGVGTLYYLAGLGALEINLS